MAYCAYTDIQVQIQTITFSATSDPSTTEVGTFCDQVSAAMDAVFNALGITTPITGTAPLNIVKAVAVNGVCAMVLRSIDMESEAAKAFQALYDSAMKQIERLPGILKTAAVSNGPTGTAAPTERKYERETDQW